MRSRQLPYLGLWCSVVTKRTSKHIPSVDQMSDLIFQPVVAHATPGPVSPHAMAGERLCLNRFLPIGIVIGLNLYTSNTTAGPACFVCGVAPRIYVSALTTSLTTLFLCLARLSRSATDLRSWHVKVSGIGASLAMSQLCWP